MIGIYFLIRGKKIVYVGQSTNIERRIIEHYRDKVFDSYRAIYCEQSKLLMYEKRLIKYFNPEYNRPTGGARPGSGRKLGYYPSGERQESVPMRIPESMVPMVKEYISLYKKGVSQEEINDAVFNKYSIEKHTSSTLKPRNKK